MRQEEKEEKGRVSEVKEESTIRGRGGATGKKRDLKLVIGKEGRRERKG